MLQCRGKIDRDDGSSMYRADTSERYGSSLGLANRVDARAWRPGSFWGIALGEPTLEQVRPPFEMTAHPAYVVNRLGGRGRRYRS